MSALKHVVLFKVRKDIPQPRVDTIFAGFAALVGRIPGLVDYSGGVNSSPEPKSQGYTHGFVMTFADEASRDAYLPHPLHKIAAVEIRAVLEEGADCVLVLDWVG